MYHKLDTQLELSVDTLKSTAVVAEKLSIKENTDKKDAKEKKKEPLLERFPTVYISDLLN